MIRFYEVDEGETIAVKKIEIVNESFIIFIDCKTDGINFSYMIKANYSTKNIENFLKSKFKHFKQK